MSSSMALKDLIKLKNVYENLQKFLLWFKLGLLIFFFTLPSLYHYGNSNNHNLFPYFVIFLSS